MFGALCYAKKQAASIKTACDFDVFCTVWCKFGVNGVNPRHQKARKPHKHRVFAELLTLLGTFSEKDETIFSLYDTIA